jgi:CheY-like chemotaxis protein
MSKKPTILCVDDQASNLTIRAMLLEQFGCAPLTAVDHRSALQVLSNNHIDLAVIDYHLALGETGEDIARDLRVLCPDLPMIMLTGDSKLPQSAIEAVDEVLIKGASSPRALLDLIEKLLPAAELRPRHVMLVPEPEPKRKADPKPEERSEKAS